MSVTIGSWGIPALVTIAVFGAAFVKIGSYSPTGGSYFPDFGGAILAMVFLPLAAILSLISWLVWALA